jgi:hypothetical protein
MIAATSWPHSQHRSDNLRASTIGARQHTSRKYSAERFGSSQANRVVTLGERQAAQTTLPSIMVLYADK